MAGHLDDAGRLVGFRSVHQDHIHDRRLSAHLPGVRHEQLHGKWELEKELCAKSGQPAFWQIDRDEFRRMLGMATATGRYPMIRQMLRALASTRRHHQPDTPAIQIVYVDPATATFTAGAESTFIPPVDPATTQSHPEPTLDMTPLRKRKPSWGW